MAHHRRYPRIVTPDPVGVPMWDYPEDYEDYYPEEEERECWYCRGEGWGIVGTDWDSDDPINGPYPGEIEKCPCCHGSGNAEDCTFW